VTDLIEGTWALLLPGWDDMSTWGYDSGTGSFFAQLTNNNSSDDDGPDVWITPGQYPVISNPGQLQTQIAGATGATASVVAEAMNDAIDDQGAPPQYRVTA